MLVMQNMMAATHHEQQQAINLSFGDTNIENHAAKDVETEMASIGEELATLIPTIGDGRHRKTARDELAKQDQG